MDTMEPLISAIIPVYNMEPYLARCLDYLMEERTDGCVSKYCYTNLQ